MDRFEKKHFKSYLKENNIKINLKKNFDDILFLTYKSAEKYNESKTNENLDLFLKNLKMLKHIRKTTLPIRLKGIFKRYNILIKNKVKNEEYELEKKYLQQKILVIINEDEIFSQIYYLLGFSKDKLIQYFLETYFFMKYVKALKEKDKKIYKYIIFNIIYSLAILFTSIKIDTVVSWATSLGVIKELKVDFDYIIEEESSNNYNIITIVPLNTVSNNMDFDYKRPIYEGPISMSLPVFSKEELNEEELKNISSISKFDTNIIYFFIFINSLPPLLFLLMELLMSLLDIKKPNKIKKITIYTYTFLNIFCFFSPLLYIYNGFFHDKDYDYLAGKYTLPILFVTILLTTIIHLIGFLKNENKI